LPYDFTQAQFSATGFITEGITTYYGELMLWQSGVWSWEKMVTCILDWLNTHLNNPGRFSSSLLDSSIDTWVDGYVKGTPGRKVSIYNEGALLAFLTDVFIIKSTSGEKSLDDVMRVMLLKYNTQTIGYTIEDYWRVVEEVAGAAPSQLICLCSQPEDYTTEVLSALEWLDQKCRLINSESRQLKVVPIALKERNKLSNRYRC
jgi:predicted metalloprotease with PDZ domain